MLEPWFEILHPLLFCCMCYYTEIQKKEKHELNFKINVFSL